MDNISKSLVLSQASLVAKGASHTPKALRTRNFCDGRRSHAVANSSRVGTCGVAAPKLLSNGIQEKWQMCGVAGLSSSLAPMANMENGELNVEPDGETKRIIDDLRVYQLVKSYQMYGCYHAKLDPLKLPTGFPFNGVTGAAGKGKRPDYRNYGFKESDLDRYFDCRIPQADGFHAWNREPITLRKLVERLDETYCGSIGVEFLHISDGEVLNFLKQKFETPEKYKFSNDMRCRILIRTIRAQTFENFCHQKFPTTKRFGVDGCECLIVAMKEIVKRASGQGVNSLVVGMAHRGRLNVLMNVMHKPLQQIVSEFKGVTGFHADSWGALGDVKYHLGTDLDHFDVDTQRKIHLSLLPNPSHLEAVDPVVLGNCRAQQYFSGDSEKRKTLPIMVHGDASVSGQGVIYECAQMSKLKGYSVGGTIHIIANNQVGFTTRPSEGGSGTSCASIARAIDAPILHVNADDPEAVTYVAQVALDFRQKFGSDIFINLVGYRRFGHNELDMPKFTQPEMYTAIDKHPPVETIYSKHLMDQGVINQQYMDEKKKECLDFYGEQYDLSKTFDPTTKLNQYTPQWQGMARPNVNVPPRLTGVEKDVLLHVGNLISTLPSDFSPHPAIGKLYDARLKALQTGKGVDFGLGEALAYGTLLNDGFHVRLAGQDCERGTFSHRHSVVHDQKQFGRTYCNFNALTTPHKFEVHNSLLSEYAAMGFEYGYALEHPDSLVIWEAQFGDFCNGGQIVIDQFIASAEAKWGRQCGLTLLLPHGYDGMGPEHSSARMERFLQLCDDREEVIHPNNWDINRRSVIQQHNIQIVNPSTPSQHFHVLRRQLIRGFRKPLVIFSPKKLLKLRAAVSDLSEMTEGTRFRRYIPDVKTNDTVDDASINRLICCSGQFYYDLIVERAKRKAWNVAIARVEQLSPFPFDHFIDDASRLPNLKDIVWVQEEPMNAGAWSYVSKRIMSSLKHMGHPNGLTEPLYVGRDVSATPASGDVSLHDKENAIIMKDAFDLSLTKNSHYDRYIKDL